MRRLAIAAGETALRHAWRAKIPRNRQRFPGTRGAPRPLVVASSDRALRFLARDRPDIAEALVRELVPGLLGEGTALEPESVDDPRLDLPPPLDADFIARVGKRELLHVEFQGYRDTEFVDRLFRYHLSLVLRYRERSVTSVAIWLLRPPAPQRVEVIQRGRVRVDIASVVLSEVKASRLLQNERTACFASVADSEAWTADELCQLVAEALSRTGAGASFSIRHAAVVLAAACGRYHAMIRAMSQLDPPMIIEDLVKFGEDRGMELGIAEGLRRGILDVFDARGIEIDAVAREKLAAESDLERLRGWNRRAAVVASAAEVFE